jgi:sugar/nucleoside kinase (ribokinase family)
MEGFLSPATAVGTIVLAIIAWILIGLLQHYRALLIRRTQDYARTRPYLQKALRQSADVLYPTWRSRAGFSRAGYGTEWRIQELRKLKRRRFVIVGGIYLDIALTPIDVNQLEDQEFNDLDTIRMDCGGSACYVGRYLFVHHRQRSDLFSRLGSGDRISATLLALLRHESWINKLELTSTTDAQSGVSVHLLQRDRAFHTTFTHMGSLASLEWRPILEKLLRKTKAGGVLYISGYFRTNLCLDLSQTLRQLSPKLLICVDHGRFRAGVNQNAEMALVNAFRENLVDVYICTFDEIRELMLSTGLMVDDALSPKDALEIFAHQRALPPITVVRSNAVDRSNAAFVLFDGTATEVEGLAYRRPFEAQVGPKNAFNAAFVYALSHSPREFSLRDTVDYAMKRALDAWADPH